MAGLDSVAGQTLARARLSRELATGRLSHAYILSGEKGIGKGALARALILEIFKSEEALVLADSHPDVIYLRRARESSIGVEDIRRGIVDTIDVRPFYPGRKVYVIEDAQLMTAQAQNALLKTLEEPPEYALLLLLTQDEDALLDTVLSRCSLIRLRPLTDREMMDFLSGYALSDEEKRLIARFSGGLPGRAGQLAESASFPLWRESLTSLMSGAGTMSQAEIRSSLADLREKCPDITEALALMELMYRDALLGPGADTERILSALTALSSCRKRLYLGVHPDEALILLFVRIKEIYNGEGTRGTI